VLNSPHTYKKSSVTNSRTAYELLYSKNPPWNKHLKIFGDKHIMIQSRNIVWLQQSYGSYIEKPVTNKSSINDSDLDDFNYQYLNAEYPMDVYQEFDKEYNLDATLPQEQIEAIDEVPYKKFKHDQDEDIVQ
jgi:hypothetical protein